MKFSPATQAWLDGAFAAPTAAQSQAWDAISQGHHSLVVAPTGSGKTLAAFLWAIDAHLRAANTEEPAAGRILYISPLKALASDVERNLRAPLTGIQQQALGMRLPPVDISIAIRTGDTSAAERRRIATHPPDILITTPESLFLMLTSNARSALAEVSTVIVDEIHAIAGTKRGSHLALSLERLDGLLDRPAQRIGLSATVTPVDTVAQFLSGSRPISDGGRPVTIVQPQISKERIIEVEVPVPDLTDLPPVAASGKVFTTLPDADGLTPADTAPFVDLTGDAAGSPQNRGSLWPHIENRIVDLIAAHRSTLVFVNSRRTAERLTARINEEWQRRNPRVDDAGQSSIDTSPRGGSGPAAIPGQSGVSAGAQVDIARAHHGSMSADERRRTEEELKLGRLPAVVATSSLELGIDMGSVDLVIQIGAPPSVASGLQRVGRAGHAVGEVSHGVLLPTHRGELLTTTVTALRMFAGELEAVHVPRNALDVLAQHVVAMVSIEDVAVVDLATIVRRAMPYQDLPQALLIGVLDMLSGRYPSQDFAELRPRIEWDRSNNALRGRPGAQRIAVTSGGTIPDRGLYPVVMAGAQETSTGRSRRVGELDEEMVYESRVGDVITLGSSSWRIDEISPQQVIVTPMPGAPARLPFWKGDGPGRPFELGRAIGAWTRLHETQRRKDPAALHANLTTRGLNPNAADNLVALLGEQHEATGHTPTDTTIIIERFRDEIGDWRVIVHSPFGSQVHAPWAMVIRARIQDRYGLDASVSHSDDGIVLRMPPSGEDFSLDLDVAELLIDPAQVHGLVRSHITDSVMFASRFREAAARALLLPKRSPDRRQPLWQQRHRASQLLAVAAQYPDFPIVFEAIRECLQDDMDLAALIWVMTEIARNKIRVVDIETPSPSPFARSLLMGYTAQFLYDGDAPLAERKALALSLDPVLLAEILGTQAAPELAELLDEDVLAQVTAEVMRTAPGRRVTTPAALWDLLRSHGPLSIAEITARADLSGEEIQAWLTANAGTLVMNIRFGAVPEPLWCSTDDAARLRDGLGVPLPSGIADAYLEPVADPLGDLIRQHARSHGPFTSADLATRFGVANHLLTDVVQRLIRDSHLTTGPGGSVIDPQVLRRIKRMSLAKLRGQVEAVEAPVLARFLTSWQHLGALQGREGLRTVIEQLAGLALPVSALESHILPARVTDYSPAMLDDLMARGEVLWAGHQRLPGARGDAIISLHIAHTAPLTVPAHQEDAPDADARTLAAYQHVHDQVLAQLSFGGQFIESLTRTTGAPLEVVAHVLWSLAWQGKVTSDNPAAWRELVSARGGGHKIAREPARPRAITGASAFGQNRISLSAVMSAAQMPLRTGEDNSVPPSTDPVLTPGNVPRATSAQVAAARAGGRWSVLPTAHHDAAVQAHADSTVLLQRYGVVTRNLVNSDELRSPAATIFSLYQRWEEEGLVRRGYFVEKNGGSQYALGHAVEELRRHIDLPAPATGVYVLAATDPANPYGHLVPWPQVEADHKHRPARRSGAIVVLVDGHPVLYSERSGHALISTWERGLVSAEQLDSLIDRAVAALVQAVRAGNINRLTIKRIDGTFALDALVAAQRSAHQDDPVTTRIARALRQHGAVTHTQGLRIVGPHARR